MNQVQAEEREEELRRVMDNHEKTVEKLQTAHNEEKAKYKKKIGKLEANLSAFVDNLMNGSESKNDVLKELKQEVESLRAVVEMKNEELRSARQDRESLDQSVTSLNESQRKVESLTFQVEDLKGLLEVKVCLMSTSFN